MHYCKGREELTAYTIDKNLNTTRKKINPFKAIINALLRRGKLRVTKKEIEEYEHHLRECNACRAYIAGQINANAGALQATTFVAEVMGETHDVNSHDEGKVICVSTWGR